MFYIRTIKSIIYIIVSLVLIMVLLTSINNHKRIHTITLSRAPQTAMPLLYLAEDLNLFKKHKLNVTFRDFTTGKKALADVIAGHSELAVTYEMPFVVQSFQHEDLRVLASIQRTQGAPSLLIRKERDERELIEIGVVENTNSDYFVKQLIESSTIDPERLKISYLTLDEIQSRFNCGQLSAIASCTPNILLDKLHLTEHDVIIEKLTSQTELALLVSVKDALRGKRKHLKKLFLALQDAKVFFENNRDEALSLLQNRLPKIQKSSLEAHFSRLQLLISADNTLLTILNERGEWYQKQNQDLAMPNYRTLIDTRYLESALPNAVTLPKQRSHH